MDPSAIIADRVGSLRERRFQFTQDRADTQDALRALTEARAQATAEAQMAIEANKLQTETQRALDTANFLHHYQNVHHDDPYYEDKVATLAATFPLAGGDKNIEAAVSVKNKARADYIEAKKAGGEYEFADGPARDAFHAVYAHTKDFAQARAAGRAETGQIDAVRKAKADGYLTDEDFATTPGAALPEVYHPNGQINYNKALDLAASRAGKATGAAVKQTDKELETAQGFVTSYLKSRETSTSDDPVADQLYKLYSQRLLTHEQSRNASNAPTTADTSVDPTAVAPTSAPAAGTGGPTLAATPRNITSQAEYDAMAPGETAMANGKLFRKPLPK